MREQLTFNTKLDYPDTFEAGVLAALEELEKLDTNNVGMVHPVTMNQIKTIKEILL